MFETLSKDTLIELAKVGDRSLFKSTTSIDEMMACIEQATTECLMENSASNGRNFECVQVASGFRAAQQILTAWWTASESSLVT